MTPDSNELIRPRAILFDMDGTLTEPMLDFPAIKAEMGIGASPILEAMSAMDPAQLARAQAILDRHEERAARHSTLNPGCRALLDWLVDEGIATALVTRNSRASVEIVLERHRLRIEQCVTREDAPPKPSPLPLALACQRLGAEAESTWMIGDGQYDIEAGRAGGLRTVWLSHRRRRPFEAAPWREARDLWELGELLRRAVRAGL